MTTNGLNEQTRRDLQKLARERPEYEEFLRVFARRERNASATELEKFLQTNELAAFRDPRGRSQAIEFFRRLAQLGLGEFRVGRRSKPTRFIWTSSLIDVAAAALGDEPKEQLVEQRRSDPVRPAAPARLLTHSYVLRESLVLSVELPVDLTTAEAKRLSTFIQTLPLDMEKGEKHGEEGV